MYPPLHSALYSEQVTFHVIVINICIDQPYASQHSQLSTSSFCSFGPISASLVLSAVIIIINPLTARVVGAPQMILQPVFSISMCMSWVE